jgi:hypothetical protein
VSPVDIVDDLLARLDVVEPTFNAFVVLDREAGAEQSREPANVRGLGNRKNHAQSEYFAV